MSRQECPLRPTIETPIKEATMAQTAIGTEATTQASLHAFAKAWAMVLTTHRRDGRRVDTRVNVAVVGDGLVFRTYASAGKVKRLARDPRCVVSPANVRGRPTGPSISGVTRPLDGADEAAAARAIDVKYPFFQRLLVRLGHRLRRYRTVHYGIALRPS